MTLTETIRDNWADVNSAKRLRGCILHAARRLRVLGHAELADAWTTRTQRIPRRLGREAINVVLTAACLELDQHGIAD